MNGECDFMSVSYGFFDSVTGDRRYTADDISNYFLKLISNGVFATPSNAMQVQAGTGMTVNVSAGWGFINCKWINNSSAYPLTLDASSLSQNRIDRIVLRLDTSLNGRCITIEVKKGTNAANPTPPVLTREGDIYELSLAQIYVAAEATAISQADITDERPDTSVCGFVTGLINQIDTTNLFAQFTAAFNNWFDDIKTELVAATLVQAIRATYIVDDVQTGSIDISALIPQYNYNLDILNVYVNGLKLIKNTDYTETHNAYGETTIYFPLYDLDVVGTPVEIEVLKAVDTQGAESVVNQVNAILSRLGGLSFRKLTQAQYDAMATHDGNTLYIITD